MAAVTAVIAAAAIEVAAAARELLEEVEGAAAAPRRKKLTHRGGAQDAQPRREWLVSAAEATERAESARGAKAGAQCGSSAQQVMGALE